jgi:phasin family protein
MSDIKAKRAPRDSIQHEAAEPSPVEAATPIPPETPQKPAPAPIAAARPAAATEDVFAYGQQAWAAFAEAQAAAARGFEALIGEINTLTRSEIAAATDSATKLLGVKTLAEAVEVNLGYARRSFDALVGSTAKLSEIGVKTAADASRPVLTRFGSGWKAMHFG